MEVLSVDGFPEVLNQEEEAVCGKTVSRDGHGNEVEIFLRTGGRQCTFL